MAVNVLIENNNANFVFFYHCKVSARVLMVIYVHANGAIWPYDLADLGNLVVKFRGVFVELLRL